MLFIISFLPVAFREARLNRLLNGLYAKTVPGMVWENPPRTCGVLGVAVPGCKEVMEGCLGYHHDTRHGRLGDLLGVPRASLHSDPTGVQWKAV